MKKWSKCWDCLFPIISESDDISTDAILTIREVREKRFGHVDVCETCWKKEREVENENHMHD